MQSICLNTLFGLVASGLCLRLGQKEVTEVLKWLTKDS